MPRLEKVGGGRSVRGCWTKPFCSLGLNFSSPVKGRYLQGPVPPQFRSPEGEVHPCASLWGGREGTNSKNVRLAWR